MNADVKSQTLEELQSQFQSWGEPAYRVTQLFEWLYGHRATGWDSMSNLPRSLRDRLQKHYSLHTLALVQKQGSADTTQKFLWRLPDASLIESVLIPASPALYGDPSDRHTLCVSTQVGCAYGCKFCASGLEGWKRNLHVEEIVEQVLGVERWHATQKPGRARLRRALESIRRDECQGSTESRPTLRPVHDPDARPMLEVEAAQDLKSKISDCKSISIGDLKSQVSGLRSASFPRLINNLVIMGMGEPLANYDNLLKALKILNAPWGCGIGARKITVSTSGLAPQIRRLAGEPLQFRLAISLHGATDEVRNKIMPVNHKYPLKELIAACEYYQKQKGRMITLEYILIAGVNDSVEQTKPLAELANRLNAKINLIPYNQVEGLPWQRPDQSVQEAFLNALVQRQVVATLRREKGHDIDAACGQLRLKVEREQRNAMEAAPV